MREIGGYLCLDKYNMQMRYEDAIALNSGRNCLAYLIKKRVIKKLYLPKFLCASVYDICKQYNVKIECYSVGMDFLPLVDEIDEDSWLYIVNYYGQINNKILSEYKKKYGQIIVDNIQAFFQDPLDGVDTIYTCRKFFGVADGAFLFTDLDFDESLEYDESWDRMKHLVGSFEKGASNFYSLYALSESIFGNMPIKRMSILTNNLLHGIDYEFVKKKRTNNYMYLYEKFNYLNKLNLIIPDGPYMYPFYIEEGEQLRKRLQQIKIFIPTLWPDVFDVCKEEDLEYDMARNILPLPVDQRYGIEDMKYVEDMIISILSEI